MKRSLRIFAAACMAASLFPANIYGAENFTVTPTGITADGVSNNEGFGSITMNTFTESGTQLTENFGEITSGWGSEYHGLVNRDLIVFPYTQGTAVYRVSGGVISYMDGEFFDIVENWDTAYAAEHQPKYYDLYGNRLFERFTLPDVLPEWLELDEIEARGYTLAAGTMMNNGYAKVVLNYYPGMVGGNLIAFIDKTGKVICIADAVDPSFNTPNGSEWKGLGWFGDNGWIVYSEPYYYDEDSNGIFAEQSSRILGYLDVNGQEVLNVSHMYFKDAWPFAEGLSVVEDRNGLKGAIDTNGNLAIPCLYRELTDISGGIFCAQAADGKWGYIDKAGQTVIPFMYDGAYGWADGLGAVVLNGKCGLVDAANNIVLPLEYDDISSFANGVCYAIKDRQLYVITR